MLFVEYLKKSLKTTLSKGTSYKVNMISATETTTKVTQSF